jgi:hypothetical protein
MEAPSVQSMRAQLYQPYPRLNLSEAAARSKASDHQHNPLTRISHSVLLSAKRLRADPVSGISTP